MIKFVFASDGARGLDGVNGCHGHHGMLPGAHGQDGQDAGWPTPGLPAGSTLVYLESPGSGGEVGENEVFVRADVTGLSLEQHEERSLPVAALDDITVTSIGGDGGHGGVGGDGGNGARGHAGMDATRYSHGTNGGPGGHGGDGGRGSDGACGGHGGLVRITLHSGDEYLLMAVLGVEYDASMPGGIVHGGAGGRRGRHGVGGLGGPGGPGGASYSWTESHTETYSWTDSNGNTRTDVRTVYTHHHNPGGCCGPHGSPGRTPGNLLRDGEDGANGGIELVVLGERAGVPSVTYARRYNLEMMSFHLAEEQGPDLDGVFEFGETCNAAGFVVRNTGGMPTPSQRVRFILK
eukprot:RCo017402